MVGGAKLEVMPFRMLPSNSTVCVCVSGGGAGASEEKEAGLEDVVTLGRVQLRVVGVRHHAAVVLTVVSLSG